MSEKRSQTTKALEHRAPLECTLASVGGTQKCVPDFELRTSRTSHFTSTPSQFPIVTVNKNDKRDQGM